MSQQPAHTPHPHPLDCNPTSSRRLLLVVAIASHTSTGQGRCVCSHLCSSTRCTSSPATRGASWVLSTGAASQRHITVQTQVRLATVGDCWCVCGDMHCCLGAAGALRSHVVVLKGDGGSMGVAKNQQSTCTGIKSLGFCCLLSRQPREPTPSHFMHCINQPNNREQCLRDLGYTDIFKSVKDTENAAALELLPKVRG